MITFLTVAPTKKPNPVNETKVTRPSGRRRVVLTDDRVTVRPHFRVGDVVPILCEYCGEVFDHEVKGPGRFPPLCGACREDPEARYYTKTRSR